MTNKRQGFQCKQFTVLHDQCAMKVGTDSLILGSLMDVSKAASVLDIGTGCGILALMAAQKSAATSCVDAIEIDSSAAKQANDNFRASPWPQKLTLYQAAFQTFCLPHRYDVIVSNPPYFSAVETSREAYATLRASRNTARHDDALSPEELFSGAAQLLAEGGKLYCLYPFARAQHAVHSALLANMHLQARTDIKATAQKAPHVAVFEFSRVENSQPVQKTLTIRHANNAYTDAFITLCREFYLHFPDEPPAAHHN